MIVLDTHVLLWRAAGSARLGRRTARRLDQALHAEELAVSAFSFWEVGLLVAAGRVRLRATVDEFRAATLAVGIREIPVDGTIAILSTRIEALHADPADRILVATALAHAATFVTADAKLLSMRAGPSLLDAAT